MTTNLAVDAEGYSRVMDADEVRALGASPPERRPRATPWRN
jgi:hypothetical protein